MALYDQLGGRAGLTMLAHSFYGEILATPSLAPFFEKMNMDAQERMFGNFLEKLLLLDSEQDLSDYVFYIEKKHAHLHQYGLNEAHIDLFFKILTSNVRYNLNQASVYGSSQNLDVEYYIVQLKRRLEIFRPALLNPSSEHHMT